MPLHLHHSLNEKPSRRRMHSLKKIRRVLSLSILFSLALGPSQALAGVFDISYITDETFEQKNGVAIASIDRIFGGAAISASLQYDSNGPLASGTFYQATSNWSGGIAGNTFSDALGGVGVQNNFVGSDVLALTFGDEFTPISGFDISVGGTNYSLVAGFLLWTDGEFLSSSDLPKTLPPLGAGVMLSQLIFQDINNNQYRVSGVVQPAALTVPAPGVLLLFGLGLVALRLKRGIHVTT